MTHTVHKSFLNKLALVAGFSIITPAFALSTPTHALSTGVSLVDTTVNTVVGVVPVVNQLPTVGPILNQTQIIQPQTDPVRVVAPDQSTNQNTPAREPVATSDQQSDNSEPLIAQASNPVSAGTLPTAGLVDDGASKQAEIALGSARVASPAVVYTSNRISPEVANVLFYSGIAGMCFGAWIAITARSRVGVLQG